MFGGVAGEAPMDDTQPMPKLRFKRVSAAKLARISEASVYNWLDGDPLHPLSMWMIDGEQSEPYVEQPLEIIGLHSMLESRRRRVPTTDPWGELKIYEDDITPKEMHWRKTPDGIYIPVPYGSIKEPLRIQLSEAGTLALRYEHQPPPGTHIIRWVYPESP
jgi:hypothetical protein